MEAVTPTIVNLIIFVLAIYVGYHVVWDVTPALHTPLMAVTNAISAIVIVGAMLAAALTDGALGKSMGVLAVALAAVNVFGGFLVTRRMLEMFRKKERKPRPHIADIAVGGGQALDRRFRDAAALDEHRSQEHQREDDVGRQHGAENEGPFGQLLERRLGQKLKEQRRQGDIYYERVHPAERLDGLAGDAGDQESEEYQAEERQDETDDVRHCALCFFLPVGMR